LTHFGNEQLLEEESLIVGQPRSQTPRLTLQGLVEPLSDRELEVLHLVATGLSNTDIAARLFITTSTVKTHINRIFSKLTVHTRTQATARARDLGLLSD